MAITNFIPTVWSENLYQALDKQYVAVANCNREFEGDIREKGNVVNICGLGNVKVSDYEKNTNMSEPNSLSDTVRTLEINRAKYFNFQIDDIDRAQASPKLMEAAMKNAASALANEADRYIYTLYSQASRSITCTETTVDNIIDYLIKARTMLLSANVADPREIVFEVSPDIAELIFKAKLNLSSDNTEALEKGCIGNIGGCKIFVTNNLFVSEGVSGGPAYKCMARTKRAIAFAEQLSEIEAYRPELRFADAVKGLHLYGAKVVYPNELVVLDLELLPDDM